MTEKFDYMSDEELELLIADVEQNELVAAPPDMLEEILERVRESDKSVTNIREFRRYCFKVCASVAAAVVLVFVLPVISENSMTNPPENERFVKESRYATKEEALNDQSYLMEKLGGTNIFSKEREIGIFNGEMEDK